MEAVGGLGDCVADLQPQVCFCRMMNISFFIDAQILAVWLAPPPIPVHSYYLYFLSLNVVSNQTIINSFSFLHLCAFVLRVPPKSLLRVVRDLLLHRCHA